MTAVPAIASKIVEDSRVRFVLDDNVVNSRAYHCDDDKAFSAATGPEAKFIPEDVFFEDGNDMPFRYYRVAVPSSEMPVVQVVDVKTVELGRSYCSNLKLNFSAVEVSAPVLKDGVWVTDIRVPLILKKNGGVALRKNFTLKVDFAGNASGIYPGKRIVSHVANPAGASRFGLNQNASLKKLRKEAEDQTKNVNFVAQLFVGDKNLGTFNEDGLYAVEYGTLRNALAAVGRGTDLDGFSVDQICLYGASPDTLADQGPTEALRNPNQLFEIPIEIRDHSPNGSSADGIFDQGDSLLFVGYGNTFWKRCDREDSLFVNGGMDYFHSYSPYSVNQGFLVGVKSSGKGARMNVDLPSPAGTGSDVAWMRYVRAEKDMILRDTYFGRDLDWESATGKEWFWKWHSKLETSVVESNELNTSETTSLPGMVPNGKQYVGVSYFPYRSVGVGSAVAANDQTIKVTFSGESYQKRMSPIRFNFTVNDKQTSWSESVLIPGGNFRIDNPGLRESGNNYSLEMLPNAEQFDRFDGYTVAYQWKPTVKNAEWMLPGSVGGVIRIPVESNVRVMKFVNLRPVGSLSSSGGYAKDSVNSADDVRYLAFKKGSFRSGLTVQGIPKYSGSAMVDFDNPDKTLEYLIVAPTEFLGAANALAEFRKGGSAVSTIQTGVVAVEDIYRRYTAGRVSPVAIRNYLAYVRSVCPNLQYVLLAGSGHYDYRGMNGNLGPIYIPPFEKEDHVTEDFFGVLDPGERIRYGEYDLDLSVGRLPVSSAGEFQNYILKVREYEQLGQMDNSDWRSTLILAADDNRNGTARDPSKHTLLQEATAQMVDSMSLEKGVNWSLKKMYLVDYEEDAAGQKKDAATNFLNLLNQGALFTTYYGHGSKTDWASEGLLKPSYLNRLSNRGRYTILGSFSCMVGRFDEGNIRSLSEEFLVAKNVGAIASIGAARETYKSYNKIFAQNILRHALFEKDARLGDAFFKAKNSVTKGYSADRFNNEHYAIVGEPVLQMPRDGLNMKLDQKLDTLQALEKVKLSGQVEGLQDGYVDLIIREGRVVKRTDLKVDDDSVDVSRVGMLVYSEKVPVKMGRFETELVTPRKITIGDTAAEFSAWAYSSNNPMVARRWIRDIVISGVSNYADSLKDTLPPTIKIQPCYSGNVNTDFAHGQVVKLQAPACLQVVVEDGTALDFREQADEGISFEVMGVVDPFHPWPYLEQSTKRAKLRMTFPQEQYPEGTYAFNVRAQDVLGNVSNKLVNVTITGDIEDGLADVFNVPNPVGKNGTTFYFKNLAVDRESKVNIFIYNQNGKLVKVLKDVKSGVTHWNGRDNHGRPLANGLYHYVVRSEVSASGDFGKKTFSKKQKLLISR